ncbi:ABC transporter permease [Novosphingobium sp. Gsoil 351]|uniref:ABC transporter permease n=1 Tax=Novosphingobium sp. Gsoil 351 TaxID=2675225 RepID=UPI0012B4EA6F|nr:ABC transporter permease [Novosphingobium sp. Gsoil 351]QGN55621.1 ABC transporter permease subunit [Novosphingobium sp. Gsoil 351]
MSGERALLGTGIVIVAVAALCAVFGPALAPHDPTLASGAVSQPPPPVSDWPGLFFSHGPSPFWLGTDAAGFDVLSRTIVAARTDLVIALAANLTSFAVGVSLGLVAGFFRNLATETLMRASDLLQSFPVFITAMILVALGGRSLGNIVAAMVLLYAPIYLRLTRAEVLIVKDRGFVEAARAGGATEWRIALLHVLPNALRPALVQSSVTIGFAILLTSGLSFVGAGVRPPTPEWGLMIANGAGGIVLGDWWPALVPGIAISLTVFGFACLGHALERHHDR